MRLLIATLVAAVSTLLLLLSSLPATPASAQGTTPSRTLKLEAGERGPQYYFDPAAITVPTGQVTVTMSNMGARPHNFSVEALGVKIPDVGAGKSSEATLTFTTPGTYEFICDLPGHAARGAKGTITVVAAPAASSAPTATSSTPAAGSSSTSGSSASTGSGGQTTARPATAPAATTASARNLPLLISLAIHIPSAVVWLGLALYNVIVVAVPFLTPAQRGGLLYRPRWLAVALIPLITVTGIFQTINNPFSTVTDFASLEALRNTTAYGEALFFKHGFVLASLVLTLALSFWVAPRLLATGEEASTTAVARERRLPGWIAWGNALACLALILCVVVMVFQLH